MDYTGLSHPSSDEREVVGVFRAAWTGGNRGQTRAPATIPITTKSPEAHFKKAQTLFENARTAEAVEELAQDGADLL